MKKITKITAAALALAFLFTGCASSAPKTTAVVPNTKTLKVSPNDESTFYSLNDTIDLSSYNNVIVKQINVFKDNKVGILESNDDALMDKHLPKEISIYFQDKLSRDFNNIVANDKTTKNDLELFVAIDSINVSYDDLKLYEYIPVAFVINSVKKGMGNEKKKLRVALSLKLIDKQTGQTVATVVDIKVGKEVEDKEVITLADIKPILDKWSSRFSKKLDELRDNDLEKTSS